ncbi:MAG TPA: biopolymer transporter ExbD [Leptolyngbyaceae cyanobacterium M33_DOE_097]|uniref:Biopolymer transporter ExbD n=1 Tax=Oscillatoriales cyanobacterium SpSt-418 TaxID=2282169 RepID=A0A7C3KDU1_9CYAN|nr:biopolymer transporter ExbD [Leptolyngbyaceae cyanobacterium M33_DOE_097]
MRLPEEPDIPPQINIVPMIDVIFAILTFFIVSSLYLTRSQGLPVNLPRANTAEQQSANEQVTVTVKAEGQLFLNRQPVGLSDLTTRVQTLTAQTPETLVVISADEKVPHGQVIAVMDRLRNLPNVRLAIQAERPR